MAKVVWTDNSIIDLSQIHKYISEDSPENADGFLDRLMDRSEKQLSTFPTIGRKIPELNDPAFREIIYGNYRVMYYLARNVVSITHVRHMARDVKSGEMEYIFKDIKMDL